MIFRNSERIFLSFFILVFSACAISAQSDPTDYWLNHPYTPFTSGQTITTNSGFFYDDGGNDDYTPDTLGSPWNVRFCSENGNPITFDFTGFRTYNPGPHDEGDHVNWDYMTIDIPGQTGYVAYDFDTPQFSFTSPNGCISFGMVTNLASPGDSGWRAEISANPPPLNNEPCRAASLVVGNVCAPEYFSNKGAYNTTDLESPACHEYFGGDVWFTLVVPDSGKVKIETLPGTLTYAILDIYKSNDCTLTIEERISSNSCVDIVGEMPSVILSSGIAAGDRLYIRLFGDQAKSGTFGICATDPDAPITGFTGPGGVGDSVSNRLWLRADAGLLNTSGDPAVTTDSIETWTDYSGNLNHLVQTTSGFTPVLDETGLNTMPTVVFDGMDDRFSEELGALTAPVMLFSVASFSSNDNQSLLSLGDLNSTNTLSISRNASQNYYSFTGSERLGPVLNLNTPYLMQSHHASSLAFHRFKLGLTSQIVSDYGPAPILTDGTFRLGANYLDTDFFEGKVSEVIIYNKALNEAQEIIVANYLAAKYSYDIALFDRYALQATHKHDVAGIGRVNAGNSHTKAQSAGILAIGGASELGDNEFLLFGHDGGSIADWTSTNVPSGDGNILRLARTWRIDQTGSVGQVSVSLKSAMLPALTAGYLSYNIFVDADGDFSSGARAYGMIYTGTEYVSNNVLLNDNDHIMIGIVKPIVSFDLASSSGFENVANPSLSLSLNYAISEPFEISYSVSGGTASGSGLDYSLNPNKIVFNPGQQTALIQPAIIEDTLVEIPDEYFDVTLSLPTAGVLVGSPSTHRYSILNNDVGIVITASDTTIGSCAGSATTLTATVQGSGPYTYLWSPAASLTAPGNAVTTASPSASTVYKLTVTDSHGFIGTDSISIVVSPAPAKPLVSVTGALAFCSGDSVLLTSSAAASYLWSNLASSQSVYAKSPGNYNVIVFDIFGCTSVASDNIMVTHNPPTGAVSFTTGATVVCQNAANETYTVTAANSTSISYTVSPPSAGTIGALSGVMDWDASFSGTATITATAVGLCGITSEDQTVTVNPSTGVVSFTTGATGVCQDAANETYTATAENSTSISYSVSPVEAGIINAATGVMNWDEAFIGTATITATALGLCGTTNADRVVTVTAPTGPVIFTSGDILLCLDAANETYLATAANSTSISYSVSPVSAGTIGTVSGVMNWDASFIGTATITASAVGLCGTTSADRTVIVRPSIGAVIFTAGATEVCQDAINEIYQATAANSSSISYSVLPASSGTIDPSTGVMDWNAAFSGTATITAAAVGLCGSTSEERVVTVTAPTGPVIFTSGATVLCQNAANETYLATATNSSSFSYSVLPASAGTMDAATGVMNWNESYNGTATIVASAIGTCGTSNGERLVTVNPSTGPVVFATGATIVCQNAVDETYTATASNSTSVSYSVTPAAAGLINPLSGVMNWNSSFSGTATITATAEGACGSSNADREVSVTPPIGAVSFTTGAIEVCQNSLDETYTATAANSTSISYSVSPAAAGVIDVTTGVMNWDESFNGIATITATATGHCGTSNSDRLVTVNPLPAKPVISVIGPTSFCEGGSVDLAAPVSLSYLWSNGETTQTITVSASDSYTVQVGDGACLSSVSDAVLVTVNPLPAKPVITADGPLTFLVGGSVTLGTAAASGYMWSPGAEETQSIVVENSGFYSVSVTDLNGCTSESSDAVEVVVKQNLDKPVVTLSGDTQLCEGETLILTSEEAFGYLWSTGATSQSITVGAEGSYTLVTSNSSGIESETSDPVLVVVNPNPQISVNKTDVSCFGGLDGSASVVVESADGSLNYLWSNNATTQTIGNLAAGNFSVAATDGNSCKANASIVISQPGKIEIASTVFTASCPDAADGRIELRITGGTGAYAFAWNTGSTTNAINNLGVGLYSVSVRDANSCESEMDFDLGYIREICFDIPGIITPNNDSYNDTWIIDGLELYSGNTVEIFDRYGKRVFYMKSYDNSWDGVYEGKELPMESYHYVINLNNGTAILKGNITIVR